ncbi:hypothetical protein O181_034904 [Austropuccinia psidii MF-1]|uniref:ATP-dependent RNA helicase DBP8 n=1 Tax=Austropuccinia psidii MF-1 TaxID=1389203 RepID=A0A9Q3HA09_9BASI|nr:hypothetical protein [Austropuccinia psidii MF-1]
MDSPNHSKTIISTVTSSQKPATFASLGLQPSLISALNALSITIPTEIQKNAIPDILAGRDCIGSSHTGSGKTIAFAVPILQDLAKDPTCCFGLILTPTRELAFQIGSQLKVLGSLAVPGFSHSVIVGGMDMIAQSINLNNRPHIIIATPGRLVDHLKSTQGEIGRWDLRRCKYLVLDEADRLLTPTFADPLSYLINHQLPPPANRQTLLFTATLTDAVLALLEKTPPPGKQKPIIHLCGPSRINLPPTLKQFYSLIPSQVKDVYLYYLLLNLCDLTGLPLPPQKPQKTKQFKRIKFSNRANRLINEDDEPDPISKLPQTIIFVSKTRTAEQLRLLFDSSQLPHPIPSRSLHSNLGQIQRLDSIREFEERQVPLLISTELGSRGLDLKQVKAVINYDLPLNPDEYVHRVGRTARKNQGGEGDGISISLVGEHDVQCVLKIEKHIDGKLEEIKFSENRVLDYLGPVSKAKREAQLELDESKFGQRQKINKRKHKELDKKRRLEE